MILFPDSLDDYVDENNAVRVIEAYINSLELSQLGFAKVHPNNTGRPMYAPKDLLKLYVYGYMNRVRSSRRLEAETKRNLEVIWLMRKLSPDHKTISRFRHDNVAALKNVFRDFVKLCAKLGLYGKELVAIDGSKFKAVNSKDRNFTSKKLQERIARIDVKIEEYLEELNATDEQEDSTEQEKTVEEVIQIIAELSDRRALYESYAVELAQTGETQKSLTDPDSRLMYANGRSDVCYNVQTAVDAENNLIVEFNITNNAADQNQLTPMVERTKEILEVDDFSIVADAGYDCATDIVGSMQAGAHVHVAKTDFDVCMPTDSDDAEIRTYRNGRSVYLADRNIVLCPMGKILYPGFYLKSGFGVFHNSRACSQCARRCRKEKKGNRFRVPMNKSNFSETYDDKDLHIKQIRIVSDKSLIRRRKAIAEHPFGTIKRSMDAGYCLTKGIERVSGEFSLTFLAYNLKRVINILGTKKLIELMP
jgi:transposase